MPVAHDECFISFVELIEVYNWMYKQIPLPYFIDLEFWHFGGFKFDGKDDNTDLNVDITQL